MTRLLQLDCFDGIASEDVRHDLSVQELEEARLQAYETGYAAGWEDAVNAQEDEIARLRTLFSSSYPFLIFYYCVSAWTHLF